MYYEKKQINIFGIKFKYKVKIKDDFIKKYRDVLCLDKDYADKKIESFRPKAKPIVENMILSMTSYPERMKDVHYAIFSILNQTIQPEKFILWLAQEEFPNGEKDIPETVLQFKKFGLEIRFTDAIRSFKKIVPALREFPNSILVSADDDIFYPKTWLKSLYNSYKQDPTKIYAHRMHLVKIVDGKIQPYANWQKCNINKEASLLNFPTSVAGVLYPPKSLHPDATDVELFKKLCPNQDDVWVWVMALINNKQYVICDNNISNNLILINPERELGISGESTLASSNVLLGENDKQIINVVSYYKLLDKIMSKI